MDINNPDVKGEEPIEENFYEVKVVFCRPDLWSLFVEGQRPSAAVLVNIYKEKVYVGGLHGNILEKIPRDEHEELLPAEVKRDGQKIAVSVAPFYQANWENIKIDERAVIKDKIKKTIENLLDNTKI